jgi:hypothetical protein
LIVEVVLQRGKPIGHPHRLRRHPKMSESVGISRRCGLEGEIPA